MNHDFLQPQPTDPISKNINDVATELHFSYKAAFVRCANLFRYDPSAETEFDQQQLVTILGECDMKINSNFTTDIKAQIQGKTIVVYCCPDKVAWDDFSCKKWETKCNVILTCFETWRRHVFPMLKTASDIFYSAIYRRMFLGVGILVVISDIIIAKILAMKGVDALSLMIDLIATFWVYLLSAIFAKVLAETIPIVGQLYLLWVLKGFFSFLFFILTYIRVCLQFAEYFNIIKALKSMKQEEGGLELRNWLCGFMVVINAPRILLDTSIFASVCSLFQKHKFDPLAFVDHPEYKQVLVDMHAMVRLEKEDIKSAYFYYHPNCYEWTIIMSQSWPFLIFFVGIDSLLMYIMPLIIEIFVVSLIVESVGKSNDFRRKCNVKLIPLFTGNFMRILGSCILRGVLLILHIAGIVPIIWNDPHALFLDRNMIYLQYLHFTHILLFSFFNNTIIKFSKVLEQVKSEKRNTN